MPGESSTRCFLACWPGPEISACLDELSGTLRKQVGGRRVPLKNIHVTLAFLGDLIPAQLSAVENCCPSMTKCFDLTLDRIGYWKQGGIVWAGTRVPDPGFMEFAELIRDSLRRVGFRVDTRPFVPHLTLLRRARRRPRARVEAIEWRIEEYSLVASELKPTGSHYSILRRWSSRGDVE